MIGSRRIAPLTRKRLRECPRLACGRLRIGISQSLIDQYEGTLTTLSEIPSVAIMMLRLLLLILVVAMIVGSLPAWPYSTGWGYYPTGGLGTILAILLILMLLGRI